MESDKVFFRPTAHSDMSQPKVLKLSWSTIHEAVDSLAFLLKPLRPTLIVGISRGGLIPATLLAHRLNLCVETISASAYEGTRRTLQKPIVIEGWKTEYDNPGVLVVDDIMDSGDTYGSILNNTSNYHNAKFRFVTIVDKTPRRYPQHNLFFAQVPKDVWVKFPWEGDET